jgi:hypothetical protein
MNRILIFIVSCPILIALAGCSVITSMNPIGIQPVKLDPADWDGLWTDGEGYVFMKVKDAEQGIVHATITGLEYSDETGKLEIEQFDLFIRAGKSGKFMNFRLKDTADDGIMNEENTESYVWLLCEKNSNQLMLFTPNVDQFKSLITDGKLKGSIFKSGAMLTGTSDEITGYLDSVPEQHMLYEWKDPVPFIRISKK